MDDISESLSQKIDELIEQTTQKVVLPPATLTVLEDAAQAVAAAVRATERTYGKDITASVMRQAAAKVRAKKLLASGGAFDDNTLSQLVGMAIESNISDSRSMTSLLSGLVRGGLDVPADVEQAARDYESAAQELLVGMAGNNAASEAMDSNAPYLMFMTQEGHGVGIDDGDLDIGGLDLKDLRAKLHNDTGLGHAYKELRDAIENSAFEIVNSALDEIVTEANEIYNQAVADSEQYEQEKDASEYFPDGIGDSFAYQWNNVEQFVEKNLDDRRLGALAEVCSKALAAGIDDRKIEEAMMDVGKFDYNQGYGATGAVVSTGQIGDVEIQINTKSMKVKNPHGRETTLKDVGAALADLSSVNMELGELNTLPDFEPADAAAGDMLITINLDGYVGFYVDPKKLAAKLGVK